jgi:very-short-patch-repair endonuclease
VYVNQLTKNIGLTVVVLTVATEFYVEMINVYHVYLEVVIECQTNYRQSPANKTKGNGCPGCKNKTEKKVLYFLKDNAVKFKSQFKITKSRSYDFFLIDFDLILEIDGNQHFKQVSNWENPEKVLQNDIQKMKIALENGFSILRIYQPDIWEDKIEWKKCINDNLYTRKTPDITCKSSIPNIYISHT